MNTMQTSRIASLLAVLALSLVLLPTGISSAARIPTPENLTVTDRSPSSVKLKWDPVDEVDAYLVRRDGRQIVELRGFNGEAPTSYIDDPGEGTFRYQVVAVDLEGRRSRPATSEPITTTTSAAPPGTPAQRRTVAKSDLCSSIIPRDLRGSNLPTPAEKYACGAAMSKPPSGYDQDDVDIIGIDTGLTKPNPVRDWKQYYLVDLPHQLGQMSWLLGSAFFGFALSPDTYDGIGAVVEDMMVGFKNNPNFALLITFFTAMAAFALTIQITRNEYRLVTRMVITGLAALVALGWITGNPGKFVGMVVETPIGVVGEIVGSLQQITEGTTANSDYNLTVKPTYNGSKFNNNIRRSENRDWLIAEYVPLCAVTFGDLNFAVKKFVPNSRVTWCERHVQVGNTKTGEDNEQFEKDLKEANEDIYAYYQGEDQDNRIIFTIGGKVVEFLHNIVKYGHTITIFGVQMLLVLEMFFVLLWLLAATGLFRPLRDMATRRFFTVGHWLGMMAAVAVLMMVAKVAESHAFDLAEPRGYMLMVVIAFFVNVIMLFLTWKTIHDMREHHKARMALYDGAGQNELPGKALGAVQTALAMAGGSVAADAATRRFRRDEEEADEHEYEDDDHGYTRERTWDDVPVLVGAGSTGSDDRWDDHWDDSDPPRSSWGPDEGPDGPVVDGVAYELDDVPELPAPTPASPSASPPPLRGWDPDQFDHGVEGSSQNTLPPPTFADGPHDRSDVSGLPVDESHQLEPGPDINANDLQDDMPAEADDDTSDSDDDRPRYER